MKKDKLEEWKLTKKAEAYELLAVGVLSHDEYRVRLGEIDMVTV
jgi:hypothetical protein